MQKGYKGFIKVYKGLRLVRIYKALYGFIMVYSSLGFGKGADSGLRVWGYLGFRVYGVKATSYIADHTSGQSHALP